MEEPMKFSESWVYDLIEKSYLHINRKAIALFIQNAEINTADPKERES